MAPKLFKSGTILSFDDSTQSVKVLRNASLLVVDDKIAAIGDNVEAPPDAEVIDATDKILTPGFINTHCHMWQTAFRTMGPNTTLAEYFVMYSQYSPTKKSFSAEDIYLSCLEGYIAGLHGGVTSYVDHSHCSWDLDAVKQSYQAAVDSGARVYWCCSVEDSETCSSKDQLDFLRDVNNKGQDKLVSLGLAYDSMGGAKPNDVERTKQAIK